MNFKQKLAELIAAELKLSDFDSGKIQNVLEVPPSKELGDFALPCFQFAKELKKKPVDIALDLEKKLASKLDFLEKISVKGAYLNFFLNETKIAESVLAEILKEKEKFGNNDGLKGKKIMVEYSQPNPNKALHIGHLRNIFLGSTVIHALENASANVVAANIFNDRGIAICKAMLSYELFSNGSTPEKEGLAPDEFVGKFYGLFEREAEKNPKLNETGRCV